MNVRIFFQHNRGMKKLISLLILGLMVGCSSAPKNGDSANSSEEELPKSVSRKEVKPSVYTSPIPGKASPEAEVPPSEGLSCETPLGTLPDGGKATGYLQEEVGPNEICISDTIRCYNGQWKGDAIYKKCTKRKK